MPLSYPVPASETAAAVWAYVTRLLTNLDNIRAARIDEITAARMAELDPANMPGDIAAILADIAAMDTRLPAMDFWSDVADLVQLSATAGDVYLPDVVIALPSGVTLVRIMPIIMFGAVENTSSTGDNAIYAAYNIRVKKSTGAWGVDDIAAINLVDGEWLTPKLSRESGRVQPGDNDVKSEVDGDGTYNFRFEDTRADYANLNLYDVQMGLRVWFK